MIEIKNLSVVYSHRFFGKVYALRDVSLTMEEGKIYGIAGETGCGKSTLGKSLLKLFSSREISAIEGKILVDGENILEMTDEELRRVRGRKFAFIFQNPHSAFNPVFRVKKQIPENCALDEVGLPERVSELYPHNLSGGMLQRLQIAVAISTGAKTIIADEPTSSIDTISQAKIVKLLREIAIKRNLTLIFISHNIRLIKFIAEKVFIFYAGFLVEEGLSHDIFERPYHPYTRALLGCIPEVGKMPSPIPGELPQMTEKIDFCPFKNRCSLAKDMCEKIPPLRGEYHKVRCFFPYGF